MCPALQDREAQLLHECLASAMLGNIYYVCSKYRDYY
jgi:hypothetical protein